MKRFLILALMALIALSCAKESSENELNQFFHEQPTSGDFSQRLERPTMNYGTSISVEVMGPQGPLAHAPMYITDGALVIYSGMTDDQGLWEPTFVVAEGMQLFVHCAIPSLRTSAPVLFDGQHLTLEAFDQNLWMSDPMALKTGQAPMALAGNTNWFDDRTYAAVPSRQNEILPTLETSDTWSNDFINALASGFTEQYPLAYFDADRLTNPGYVELAEDAEVYMTFVDETDSRLHALGYFIWESGDQMADPSDIDSVFVAFKNFSRINEGGGLYPGDKILLGEFDAGTRIGFVYAIDGYNPLTSGVKDVDDRYSMPVLNGGTSTSHTYATSLYDATNERVIFGFESANLSTDTLAYQDYNDLMFYLSADVSDAFETNGFETLADIAGDTDNDGVPNYADAFPSDPLLAFTAVNTGRILFEDTPKGGDKDMNDIVVDYIVTGYLNAAEELVTVEYSYAKIMNGGGITNTLQCYNDLVDASDLTNTSANNASISLSDTLPVWNIGDMGNAAWDTWHMGWSPHIRHMGADASIWSQSTWNWEAPNVSMGHVHVWVLDNSDVIPFMHQVSFDLNATYDFSDFTEFTPRLHNVYGSFVAMNDSIVNTDGLMGVRLSNKVPWTKEGRRFTLAYPDFMDWFSSGGSSNTDWWDI